MPSLLPTTMGILFLCFAEVLVLVMLDFGLIVIIRQDLTSLKHRCGIRIWPPANHRQRSGIMDEAAHWEGPERLGSGFGASDGAVEGDCSQECEFRGLGL